MSENHLSSASQTNTGKKPDRYFHVWARLVELFGDRFLREFGQRPGPIWRQVIDELSDDQLRAGFAALIDSGSAHPPTLPEFKAACAAVVDEHAVRALALRLIPSWDRKHATHKDLSFMVREHLPRARALLDGTAEPDGREAHILALMDGEPRRIASDG